VRVLRQQILQKQGNISLYREWVPHLYYLSKRRGLVVKKLDCQTCDWRFQANRSPVYINLSVKYILGLTIQVQGLGLRIFSVEIPRSHINIFC